MINKWRLLVGAVLNIGLAFVFSGTNGNQHPFVVASYSIGVILFWISFSVKGVKR